MTPEHEIMDALQDALFTLNAVIDGAREEGWEVSVAKTVDNLLNIIATPPGLDRAYVIDLERR